MSYRRRNPLSPRAFTLVEILVVIAVIGLLVGIAVFGFNAMQRSAANNRTKVMLQGVSGMLAEYDVATGLRRQPPHMWLPTNTVYTTAGFNFWQDADPATATPAPGINGLESPGRVDFDRPEPPTGGRLGLPAVKNTQIVVGLFNQTPAAKKIMGQLPSDSFIQLKDDTANTTGWNESTPPVPMDAWENPIIFVPASGLRGVTLADTPDNVVTSTRTYRNADLPDGTVAPGARPFFASAGPDGDFTAGDDNVYSFEN